MKIEDLYAITLATALAAAIALAAWAAAALLGIQLPHIP